MYSIKVGRLIKILLLLDSELVILRLGARPMVFFLVFFLKEQSFKGVKQKLKFPVISEYMDFRVKMLAGAK